MGVPFIPVRAMLGSDTFKYSATKVVRCPFTGRKVALLPALILDVGLIHVHRADRYGNAQIDGISGFAAELARASKRLIISVEEIVPSEEIRRHPDRTIIPSPKVRLPGSGGANDVGSLCWRTITIIRHDRRHFVEKVDFITTPGYLTGPGAREEASLPPGTGPYRVVTNLAVLGFDEDTKRMKLLATNPGVTVEQVVENTDFELIIPDEVGQNPPPTAEELRILREEVDRERLYI